MNNPRHSLWALGLLVCSGCARPDPITGYRFIAQWMGDRSYEQGPTVCGVSRSRRHVTALAHDSQLTCRPQDYTGSAEVTTAFSDPPAWLEGLPWADYGAVAPITRVRGWGDWSVGLMPASGIVVDALTGEFERERVAQIGLRGAAPLADLEVAGPFAYVADGVSDLIVVDLEALVVARLSLGGPVRDVYVDGDLAAVLVGDELVIVDVADPMAPAELGRLGSIGASPDGVGLYGDHAYIAAGGRLYAVDVSDPGAPSLVDAAGQESTSAGITLIHGRYLFQAPGFDRPLAVTDLGDPANPDPFWAFMGGNGVFDVAAAGHVLYLAVGSGGVQMWGPKRDYADAFGQ